MSFSPKKVSKVVKDSYAEKSPPMPPTLIERYREIQKIGIETEVPHAVWTCFGPQQKVVSILGDQICMGEDYVSVGKAREALEWYVNQLGGSVQWREL
jgi:hypothetical protein